MLVMENTRPLAVIKFLIHDGDGDGDGHVV